MNKTDQTVFERLIIEFPEASKQSIRKWLKHGRVLVNEKVVKFSNVITRSEDKVSLTKKKLDNLPFEILYSDADIVVADKPAGMLSVASLDPTEKHVHGFLKKFFKAEKIAPLHRLDKEVAGPLIFVKNQKSFDLYKNLFVKHEIHREYRAIVHRPFEEKSGTFDSHLAEGAAYRMYETSSREGKRAITHYEVIDQNEDYALIKLNLHTGRKNQIRVHLSSANHAIIGDVKYGAEPIGGSAIALYAHHLEFIHPVSNKRMSFRSKPPFMFSRILKKTGLN
ncbi:MAG: Ribosomal large subunit pseudouridine synthase D [Chlamydiae bacterium]|nr:Ribosomal large subunit pseudouridine synthase D [Chlamydiota bacterium]